MATATAPRRAATAAKAPRKTDLSPIEALVLETTLGNEARTSAHSDIMARIQRLTRERQKLYAKSAAHPFLALGNSERIRAIGAEIEYLWDALRRERASRRVAIERALHVTAEDEDSRPRRRSDDDDSHDAA